MGLEGAKGLPLLGRQAKERFAAVTEVLLAALLSAATLQQPEQAADGGLLSPARRAHRVHPPRQVEQAVSQVASSVLAVAVAVAVQALVAQPARTAGPEGMGRVVAVAGLP